MIWTGDLNFRVTVENNANWKQPEQVSEAAYEEILKSEEFASHKEKELAFTNFTEAPIRFPPTHKFEPDTDDYVPKRIPSFTDRVLYWVRNVEWLQTIQYDCLRGACPSDHKPVYGTFWLDFNSDRRFTYYYFRLTMINKPVPERYRQQKLAEQQNSVNKNRIVADQDNSANK